MIRILHLSDPHWGDQHGFSQVGRPRGRTLADSIVESLRRANINADFDALVLNGDLFSRVEPLERAQALDGLKELLRRIGVGEVGSVPGNHDLTWDETLSHGERLIFYNDLISQLDLGLPNTRDYPHVLELTGTDQSLAVVLLDSCVLESRAQAGLGYVGTPQLDRLRVVLAERGIEPATHTLVAVLHHHLLPVAAALELPNTPDPDASPRMVVSVTIDATNVLRELAQLGFSVVFHGHQHVRGILTLSDSRFGGRPPLHVAACGSCGIDAAGVRRHFYIWEFDSDTVTAISFEEDAVDREIFVETDRQSTRLAMD